MRLMTAGQDGFLRREFQTRQRPLRANGSYGVSRTSDRSILPSAPLAAPAPVEVVSPKGAARPIPVRRCAPMRLACRLGDSSPPSPTASRRCGQSCWRALSRRVSATICAPAARATRAAALPRLLDHCGRSRHQHAAQHLISSAGDRAEPGLAGGGMIFRCWPDPGREVPAGREQARIGRLHDQRRGDDQPDPRNLCETPAVGISAVPGHQPDFDLLQFGLQLHILCPVTRALGRAHRSCWPIEPLAGFLLGRERTTLPIAP